MRRCTFRSVLDRARALCGDPLDVDPSTQLAAALQRFIHARLKRAWEPSGGWWWPESMRVEQRFYHADYAAATLYGLGSFVYHPATQAYYQALTASQYLPPATLVGATYVVDKTHWIAAQTTYSGPDWANGAAYALGAIVRNAADGRFYVCFSAHTSAGALNTAYFALLTLLPVVVSLDQVGQTAIGVVKTATHTDPRLSSRPVRVDFQLTNDGVQLVGESIPVSVWLAFQVRPPVLAGATWSSTATYASGATLYYASTAEEGDFWTANASTTAGQDPEDTPGKWDRESFPAFLREYCAQGACADWLRSQGQRDAAMVEDANAEDLLCREIRLVANTQNQGLKWRAA
jgi:hypothetical protein